MFKVEKLPINTLINSKKEGAFIKYENGLWGALSSHCGDCEEVVSEAGTDTPVDYQPGITVREKAQDFFGEFEILAVPVGFIPEEE